MITLSDEQRRALEEHNGGPVWVFDPVTHRRYVLLDADQFEKVQSSIEPQGKPQAEGEEDWWLHAEIPPGVRRSMEAYWRDLPQLLPLKSRKRQWVAYHGDERLGFGRTETELYQECFRRGLKEDQFYVDRLEPAAIAPWETIEVEPSLYEFDDPEPGEPSPPGGS